MENVKNPRTNNTAVKNNHSRFNGGKSAAGATFQAKTPAELAKRDARKAAGVAAGRYVKFENTGESGLLTGVAMFDGWPVYVIVDRDRKVHFVESNQRFEFLDFDINFSVLNYLRNNEPDFIEELVANKVATTADRQGMITPITVQRPRLTEQPAGDKKPGFKANSNSAMPKDKRAKKQGPRK